MGTYNTPYKSGTVSSVSGADLTVAGFVPAASDVGRLVVLTSGDGLLQHREIIAVAGQVLTLAHAFDESPFLGFVDVNPASGDGVAISYDLEDLVATDADITLAGARSVTIAALTLSGGAYIFARNLNIEFASGNIEVDTGGGCVFGYYGYVAGQDAYPRDSCHIVDTAVGFGGNQMAFTVGGSNIRFGLLDIYGGSVAAPGGNFWRTYTSTSTPTTTQCRWFGVVFSESFGSRVDGDRSILVGTAVGSTSTLGVSNPRSAVSRVEVSVVDCDQAAYVWLAEGAAGRFVATRLADVHTRILRVSTVWAPNSTAVYEVVAKKLEIDQVPAFAVVEGSQPANSHTLRYGNIVRPSFVNPDTSPVTMDVRTDLRDDTGTVVDNQLVTAEFAERFVRHTDIVTSIGTRQLADGTQYAPYTLTAASWGRRTLTQVISAEDTFEPSLVLLDDPLITETDKSTVDAYTQAITAQQRYDVQQSWTAQSDANLGVVATHGQPSTREGDGTLAGGHDVVVSPGLPEVFDFDGATISYRAASVIGGITTTGTVTVTDVDLLGGVFACDVVTDLPPSGSIVGVTITAGHQLTVIEGGNLTLDGCNVQALQNSDVATLTVTLASGTAEPGTTTGPVVYLLAERDFVVQGVPAGAELRIYDQDAGLGDLGTELAGVESHAGGDFTWTHRTPNNAVHVQVIAAGYVEFNASANTGPAESTFEVSLQPEINL